MNTSEQHVPVFQDADYMTERRSLQRKTEKIKKDRRIEHKWIECLHFRLLSATIERLQMKNEMLP